MACLHGPQTRWRSMSERATADEQSEGADATGGRFRLIHRSRGAIAARVWRNAGAVLRLPDSRYHAHSPARRGAHLRRPSAADRSVPEKRMWRNKADERFFFCCSGLAVKRAGPHQRRDSAAERASHFGTTSHLGGSARADLKRQLCPELSIAVAG